LSNLSEDCIRLRPCRLAEKKADDDQQKSHWKHRSSQLGSNHGIRGIQLSALLLDQVPLADVIIGGNGCAGNRKYRTERLNRDRWLQAVQ
jgi:hypothetical protein